MSAFDNKKCRLLVVIWVVSFSAACQGKLQPVHFGMTTHTWLSNKASSSLALFVMAVVTTINFKPKK